MHTKNKTDRQGGDESSRKENLELINAHKKLDKSGQRVGIML
jgi:hypothetical protein